jgi:hypothetical protein
VIPAKFKAYVAMIPRLQAEEQLAALNVHYAAGGRSLKDNDHAKLLDRLERRAAGVMQRKAPFSPGALEAMGVKVNLHRVKP